MSKRVYKSEVFAKINLSLEITGKVGNLHTLKMLVCPYEGFKDTVEFYPEDVTGITDIDVSASFDDFDKTRFLNFFMPKAQCIAEKFGVGGRLVVSKSVPLSAGLGGSSASIVGALRAMREYAENIGKSTVLDSAFLLNLGSDVPCMLYGKTCLVSGVGEIVKPVEFQPQNFGVEIAKGGSDTKACYALYDKLKEENPDIDTSVCSDGKPCDKTLQDFEIIGIDGETVRLYANDLTLPAAMLNENIQKCISDLKNKYKITFLSGSGSAVVFKTHKL